MLAFHNPAFSPVSVPVNPFGRRIPLRPRMLAKLATLARLGRPHNYGRIPLSALTLPGRLESPQISV
jgi:hypothetical protein